MSEHGLIDVHAHFTTDEYISIAKKHGHREPDGMPEAYWPSWDAGANLKLMDEAGIAKAMLSLSSPGIHFGDDTAARRLARQVNEFSAGIKRAHPDRFGQFASLPLPDVDGALGEIAHAFDDLGADGVILMTNSAGLYFGDERMRPVFAELDRRAAVVMLHPTSCVGGEALAVGYPRPMIEFLFETARTIVHLILSGNAARYPGIRFIVPHAGGVLPLLADRLELFRIVGGRAGADGPSVMDALGSFYYDLAGTPSDRQLTALTSVVKADHLLYGSDYPWTPHDVVFHLLKELDSVDFPAEQPWRHVTTRNASRLFAGTN